MKTALRKGFTATFGGQKLVFFTEQKTIQKYCNPESPHYDPSRIGVIKDAIARRSRMFPQPHKGDQIAIVEINRKDGQRRCVIIADRETSVVDCVMRCSDDYIRKHFKK